MCGIAGFCDFNMKSSEGNLRLMTDCLEKRGPDDAGYEMYDTRDCQIGFGQRRLSILDLSAKGHQPMHYKKCTIVFNGEIYNFQEIRNELRSKGYEFYTGTDTEVILAAYLEWGIESVKKFIGMFAYVIFDRLKNIVLLCRDRVGVKPLYYYHADNILMFSSELKSFHEHPSFVKELNYDALGLYMRYNYIPTPYSIFKATYKLEPGTYLRLDLKSQNISKHQYWRVEDAYKTPFSDISFDEAIDETEALLKSSFNYRMIADVPVGVFLSGGYDSTAVAALLQSDRTEKIKTFTIGYDVKGFNEAPEARMIADHLGTDHTEYYCTPKDATGIITSLPSIYDEPFSDNSVIPTILVSRVARKDVKVVLSGDGGDEIFAGYNKFVQSLKYANYMPRPIQSMLSSMMGVIDPEAIPFVSKTYNFASRYRKMQSIWKHKTPDYALKMISQYYIDSELEKFFTKGLNTPSTYFDIYNDFEDNIEPLNRLLGIDYKTFLMDNNLVKMDRATMSVGLEGREPFLDQRIIEYVAKLPSSFKIKNGVTKYILKEIVHKYVGREKMERPKMPFIAPLTVWFKDEMKELLVDHVNHDKLKEQGMFNPEPLLTIRDYYLNGGKISHQKLWNILLFQLWYEKWM